MGDPIGVLDEKEAARIGKRYAAKTYLETYRTCCRKGYGLQILATITGVCLVDIFRGRRLLR